MFADKLNYCIVSFTDYLWGWPFIIGLAAVGLILTFGLYFVQFRYFITAWKYLLFPSESVKTEGAELSPFQAFINALGTSTGNGSLAGIATAICTGGPGSAFWVLVSGIFAMIMRFAEVYLATTVTEKTKHAGEHGGPMVYLKRVPGGMILPYVFAFFLFFFGLSIGNAMQANSIGHGVYSAWGISKLTTGIILFVFISYVMIGGAQRIISVSDKLVPFKVGLFMISSLIVLIYHYAAIIPALKLIVTSAFAPQAVGGAIAGMTIQRAIRSGFSRSLSATEAGLGTAAVLFGASGSKEPMKDSIMSMLGAFISTYLVCFIVALTIVASGVWDSGLTSVALTSAAFNTVFGAYGNWIVIFLSVSFGLGVLVPFAFITRESWFFLTKGRWAWLYAVIYCLATFLGAIAQVSLIWSLSDIGNAGMVILNLYALVYFLPFIRSRVKQFIKTGSEA